MSGVAPEPFSNLLDKPVAPSPISKDILDTNNPPAEVNLSSIREFLSRGSARREVLDAKIGSLKAELEKLLEQRNFLDTEIRKHEGALSPLRRMPTEIISLIFTFATPPFTPFGNVMSVQEGPWALSAVCSRWRIIILSSPCFWTSLSLDFTDDDPESSSFAGIVPMLEAHLERSQQLPLDVTFGTFYNDDCTQRERHVLELLALHCRRWETIQFTGPSVAYTLLEDIRGDLPILRKLDVTVHESGRRSDPLHLDLFQSCPRLEEAFFNTGGYGEDCSLVTELPFPQLQRYGASNPWANHVHALRSASNLVDCMLHLPRSSQISAASSIILPHLLRLSVSTDSFLHCLDTPMLQELYCCNQSNGLHSFLKRLPKLQKLFFAETETPTIPDVTRLLHAAPTITNLGIRLHLTFLGDLFSALVPESRNESTTRIPVLDTISMRVIRKFISDDENEIPPDLDQDLLMRTVESHWQHGDWRSVNLYCPKFVLSATTLQRMEILRGQGMQIRVFPSAHSLLCHVIPPDFRLYRDFGDLFDT